MDRSVEPVRCAIELNFAGLDDWTTAEWNWLEKCQPPFDLCDVRNKRLWERFTAHTHIQCSIQSTSNFIDRFQWLYFVVIPIDVNPLVLHWKWVQTFIFHPIRKERAAARTTYKWMILYISYLIVQYKNANCSLNVFLVEAYQNWASALVKGNNPKCNSILCLFCREKIPNFEMPNLNVISLSSLHFHPHSNFDALTETDAQFCEITSKTTICAIYYSNLY